MPILKFKKSNKTKEAALEYLKEYFEQVFELVSEEKEYWVFQIDITSQNEKDIYDEIVRL